MVPRIYVASLSDYNAGRLHGAWADLGAETDVSDVQQAIGEILKASPSPDAEEFAIHDYEGFGSIELGEWEQLEHVVFLANLVAEFGEIPVSAYVCHVVGAFYEFTADDLRESYRGAYDSEDEFAQSLLIDEGMATAVVL